MVTFGNIKIMKISINIGHGGDGSNYDSGAIAADGTHEHDFNRDELVPLVIKELKNRNHSIVTIIQRKNFSELPDRINEHNPDVVLSFHFNAFNGNATGTEMLYYKTSKRSKRLAECLQDNVVAVLGLADRGIKGLESGRGVALLKRTNAPCVILEPFFGDNQNDLNTARNNLDELAIAICDALEVGMK